MRCAERLLVENRGDLAIHLLLPVKLGNALPETVLIGVLLVALHAPLQPMFACGASLPIDPDPDVTTSPLLIQRNALDHQPHDLLAVRRSGGRGAPKVRQLFAERQYLRSIVVGDRDRLLATPCVVFLLDPVRAPQSLLPDSLQRASDQAVLRLDGVILASRALGLVAGALASKRPLPLELPASPLRSGPSQRSRARSGLASRASSRTTLDFGVDRQGAHFLASRPTSLVSIEPADIDRIVAIRSRVSQAHPTSTPAAD